jgi:soluble lytic murein transglycosylase-like protein
VLRRLITAGVAAAGVGLAVTGCAVTPLKMGAAAIVDSDRITVATLDTQVANLRQAAAQYPGVVTLTPQQMTQQTLTWLVRFQINEELARQDGITVTPAQAQAALAAAYAQARSSAESAGIANPSLAEIMAANGIPPDLSAELGRYEAIDNAYARSVNGGKLPASSSAASAVDQKLSHAQCLAAKSLSIQVSPQFGRMDYSTYGIVSAPATVWRPAGPAKAASMQGLTPAC